MNEALKNYDARVAMATTQFIGMLDTLRNLRREGQALNYINPDAIPVAAEGVELSAAEQEAKEIMERLIATFGVFEEQGIFAEITGPQKERAQKLYTMLRTSFVMQGYVSGRSRSGHTCRCSAAGPCRYNQSGT